MTMKDWVEVLNNQIVANRRKFLEGKETVSHKQSIEKAENEFRRVLYGKKKYI